MFFNYDILFRNGPLALVWLAGSETLKNKNNRRHRVAVLKSNVTALCETMRNLLPQMGTAHGIPLKKMGTLAKGITIMYSMRIENFAKDVMQVSIALKRPVTLTLDPTILNKRGEKAKVTFGQPADNADVPVDEENQINIVVGFEDFEDFQYGIGYPSPRRRYEGAESFSDIQIPPFDGVHETPRHRVDVVQEKRNVRKRSRGEKEDDVLERLHGAAISVDPRAHTLLEDEPLLFQEPQQDLDLDFGDGLALLNGGEMVDQHMEDNDNLPCAPAVEESTGFCSPEMGRLRPMEITVNVGTRPENSRKRRGGNDGPERLNETVLNLSEIEAAAGGVETPRRGQRARRRLRLQVDTTTSISLRDMLDRIEAIKETSDVASLEARLEWTRAPAKSLWGIVAHQNKTALNFIATAGRPCKSIALNEMKTNILKKVAELPPPSEVQRNVNVDNSNANVGVTMIPDRSDVTGGAAGRTGVMEPSAHMDAPLEQPPMEQEQYPLDDGYGVQEEPLAPAANEIDEGMGEYQENVFVVPQNPPKRADEQEQAMLVGRGKTFEEMYPPDKCSRSKAARGFLLLLKMQGKTVSMQQEESFEAIEVQKLK